MGIKKSSTVFSTKKRKTYLRMLKSIIVAVTAIIIILVILQALGINVSSMLAGVGIASIVVGFALQDAMKDIDAKTGTAPLTEAAKENLQHLTPGTLFRR